MTAILLALMVAAVLGVSDFLAGVAGRQATGIQVVLVSYSVSFTLLALLCPLGGGSLSPSAVGWGLAMGVVEGLAMWWFYQALATGPIGVIALVAAVLAAGIPVLVGIGLGERPAALAGIGVVLGLGAVVLLGSGGDATDGRAFRGRVVALTVGAGAAFSGTAICLHHMPREAELWPVLIARIPALAIFVLVAATMGELRLPRGMPLRVAVLLGAMNVTALSASWLAYHMSLLSLIAVITALYPVTTILLAVIVLRERINRWQRVGLALALAAVVLIAV